MDLLLFILTLLALAVAVLCIAKEFYAPMTLLLVSIVILVCTTIYKGESILVLTGGKSNGNMFMDIFEFVRVRFTSAFGSNGIVLLPVFGYASYMTKLNASKLLACLAIKPLKKFNAPYYVGIPLCIIIGFLLRLAITSQTGLNALFMVCIYPVLVACGLSKLSAASVIILSTALDWGPADGPTNLVFGGVMGEGANVTDFFINYQLLIYPISIAVAIVLSIIVHKIADKKDGIEFETEKLDEVDPRSLGIPMYYAFLPMLPLVFMIVFSDLVLGSITMTAFGATIASLIIVFICETIRRKSLKETLKASAEQFLGMGVGYGSMFAMISCAQVFAGAIEQIGGFQSLTSFLATLSIPGPLLIGAVGICAWVVGIALGSSSSASVTFYPMMAGLSQAAGITTQSSLIPLLFAVSTSRSLSPISPAVLLVSNHIDVDPLVLIKRNIIPIAGGWLTATFISTVIIG